ncbi:Clavaminate synthase-like protein [Clavulina sp. PMI_390]|nr:Clavaminate synthase-like protein [Clavulina sp. PMI_390]
MAKRRKAASRAKPTATADSKPPEDVHEEDVEAEVGAEEDRSESPDTCPACKSAPDEQSDEDRTWIGCEACETWYHSQCVELGGKLDTIDKWYCADCRTKDPSRVVTFKPPARKSSRTTNKVDYHNLNHGIAGDPRRWFKHLTQKPMKKSYFKKMKGADVSLEWLQNDETAMTEPIIIEKPDGLGMKMPPPSFTVSDVAKIVGPKEKVEVLDVASQREDKGWTLQTWAEYYNKPASEREKIRNVISLEISETKLAEKITPPRLVREIDWVELMWPATKRKGATAYPKVQMYCLMSVAECWTDWHLDFAGSSVYYHILKGSKIFYFIRPTPANLAAYEKWSGSDTNQASVWLGDWVDEVVKVELVEGNTMIIPTGWIHCVYTPKDSLVFGGNFLHSWNIATQLRIRALEIATKVPKKFRFPFFRKLCWYTAEKTVKDLKAKEEFPMRVLNGLDALARFLIKESRIMERVGSQESARKDSREQVPGTIKDPCSLARELRWRVRLAAGHDSDDELESPFSNKDKATPSNDLTPPTNGKKPATNPLKRKRGGTHVEEPPATSTPPRPDFKGFIPRDWDSNDLRNIESDIVETVFISRPPTTEDGVDWFEGVSLDAGSTSHDGDHPMNGDPGPSSLRKRALRTRTTDEVVRTRRTLGEDGSVVALEREVVRRVYESYTFGDVDAKEEAPADVEANVESDPPKPADVAATELGSAPPEAMDLGDEETAIDPSTTSAFDNPGDPFSMDSISGLPSEAINVEKMLVDAGFGGDGGLSSGVD